MKLRQLGKKGALDVSINAIVVIIFAITMLSLGLAFMRGTFGKIGGQVDTAISAGDLAQKPSSEDQFVISAPEMKIKRTKTDSLEVGYYNNGVSVQQVTLVVSCPTGITGVTSTTARSVAVGATLAWKVPIKVANNAASDTHACTVTARDGTTDVAYEDFFVVVE